MFLSLIFLLIWLGKATFTGRFVFQTKIFLVFDNSDYLRESWYSISLSLKLFKNGHSLLAEVLRRMVNASVFLFHAKFKGWLL